MEPMRAGCGGREGRAGVAGLRKIDAQGVLGQFGGMIMMNRSYLNVLSASTVKRQTHSLHWVL